MKLLGDVGHVESRFFPFGDRYQLGDMGHVESHFIPFGGSVSSVQDGCKVCARCSISIQIILDAPDGTPR